MKAELTSVRPPLPYGADAFDAIISISVFTHLNEKSQLEFLAELHRICRPGGRLFLTVHGARALERAVQEQAIRDMINVDEVLFQKARKTFACGEHAFILQSGHLTNTQRRPSLRELVFGRKLVKEPFEYGITFIPEPYVRKRWIDWFEITDHLPGAIHSFQDIVVLTPRK
jgi:SAM-dependent methyltransferase